MKYKFYLNQEKDDEGRILSFPYGYKPGNKLELVYQGDLYKVDKDSHRVEYSNDMECLEALFEIFNMRRPGDYHDRSMSVGDVVVLQQGEGEVHAFAVAAMGFIHLPQVPESIA